MKQAKLDDALKQAQAFHDDLQAFITWLTTAEKNLNAGKPPSTVLDNINKQIADHKVIIVKLGDCPYLAITWLPTFSLLACLVSL